MTFDLALVGLIASLVACGFTFFGGVLTIGISWGVQTARHNALVARVTKNEDRFAGVFNRLEEQGKLHASSSATVGNVVKDLSEIKDKVDGIYSRMMEWKQ